MRHYATHNARQRRLSTLAPRYVMRADGAWNRLSIALCLALTVRIHGTAEAVQATARRLVEKVRPEQQPNMKRLARGGEDVPTDKAIPFSIEFINLVCQAEGISPGVEFKPNPPPPEPPRCHMTPMKLAGYHKHRHWRCRHCSHTKPLDWRPDGERKQPRP